MCRFFFMLVFPVLFLVACGKEENQPKNARYKLKQLLSEDNTITSFGKLDIKGVIKKTELEKMPKIGVFMEVFNDIYRYTKLEDSLYFATDIEKDNSVSSYYFLDVANRDSLVDFLKGVGLPFEEMDGQMVHVSSAYTIAINQDVCAFGFNDLGKNISLKVLSIMKDLEIEITNNAIVEQILNANSDVVVGVDLHSTLAAIYGSFASTDAVNLFENSFMLTTFQFNNGNCELKTKNLFSEKLKSQLFFKSTDGEWAQALVNSKSNLGYALNMDMKRFISFAEKLSPDFKEQLSNLGVFGYNPNLIANQIQHFYDGRIAYLVNTMPNADNQFGDFTVFLGIKDQGQKLLEWYSELIGDNSFYTKKWNDGLLLSNNVLSKFEQNKSTNTQQFKFFGKKGFTFFIHSPNFDELAYSAGFGGAIENEIDYMTFEMDNEGALLTIKAKDSKNNLLETIAKALTKVALVNGEFSL